MGPLCNLDCTYCYYLEKESLYPRSRDFRMTPEVLERYIQQYIGSQDMPEVSFGWQGGEPTLLGLEFFRTVVALQAKHSQGKKVSNTIQTNGTLLDDEWCAFFAREEFLVGLSVDGPQDLHDTYRVDKGGNPTFEKVMRGLELLKKHDAQFNTLTVVNRANVEHPLRVYRFLDEAGSRFFQFIPLVEREPGPDSVSHGLGLAIPPGPSSSQGSDAEVTPWSVPPEAYGRFLISIFDQWIRRDVGRIFVQLFDHALGKWVGMRKGLCVFNETCGEALALEHNGDLYSCDHYVYPEYRLGNILVTSLTELAESPTQNAFGEAKRDTLPRYCLECPVLFACNGECPKHRFTKTPEGEGGLNYLCRAYRRFFTHVAPHMETMAALLKQRRAPAEIMTLLANRDREDAFRNAGRNDPCPCGSGKKFKSCCSRERA
jgi:uncharacterized protein